MNPNTIQKKVKETLSKFGWILPPLEDRFEPRARWDASGAAAMELQILHRLQHHAEVWELHCWGRPLVRQNQRLVIHADGPNIVPERILQRTRILITKKPTKEVATGAGDGLCLFDIDTTATTAVLRFFVIFARRAIGSTGRVDG